MPDVKATGPIFDSRRDAIVDKVVRDVLNTLGSKLKAIAASLLPGHFKKTVTTTLTGSGASQRLVISSSDPAIKYIEEGRKPGKQPPPDVLLAWVKRKGIGANALSLKSRKPLVVGIKRTFNRKTGLLRTKTQSLENQQKSIAFLIGRRIGKEGLPRNTGFPPSHGLFVFRDLTKNNQGLINAHIQEIQLRIAAKLNG